MCFFVPEKQPLYFFPPLPSPGGHALHLADEGTSETVWLSAHWLRLNKKFNY